MDLLLIIVFITLCTSIYTHKKNNIKKKNKKKIRQTILFTSLQPDHPNTGYLNKYLHWWLFLLITTMNRLYKYFLHDTLLFPPFATPGPGFETSSILVVPMSSTRLNPRISAVLQPAVIACCAWNTLSTRAFSLSRCSNCSMGVHDWSYSRRNPPRNWCGQEDPHSWFKK